MEKQIRIEIGSCWKTKPEFAGMLVSAESDGFPIKVTSPDGLQTHIPDTIIRIYEIFQINSEWVCSAEILELCEEDKHVSVGMPILKLAEFFRKATNKEIEASLSKKTKSIAIENENGNGFVVVGDEKAS